MIIVTTDMLPGYRIVKTLGLVQGSSVRSKNVGSDIGAGLKSLVGGELKGYNEMLEFSRKTAIERMENQAMKMNANAVVGLRFSSSQITAGAAEMLAYGTAVHVEEE